MHMYMCVYIYILPQLCDKLPRVDTNLAHTTSHNRDNKYHCGSCNDKVDALKRCCISRLPDNLIIHLKRFEFDLEAMKRIKLNEYCVFPNTLDMEPYTKEGLAKKEVMIITIIIIIITSQPPKCL